MCFVVVYNRLYVVVFVHIRLCVAVVYIRHCVYCVDVVVYGKLGVVVVVYIKLCVVVYIRHCWYRS